MRSAVGIPVSSGPGGCQRPILTGSIDGALGVLDGGHRIEVAKERGLTQISALVKLDFAPTTLLECTLPPIGSSIKVRADGVEIDGIVTGHSEKDGKSVIDYLGQCMLSNRQLSMPTTRWAWVDQLIETKEMKEKNMEIQFKNIVWDTDGEPSELPRKTMLEMDNKADIALEGADVLSDKFGFCVISFDFHIADSNNHHITDGEVQTLEQPQG